MDITMYNSHAPGPKYEKVTKKASMTWTPTKDFDFLGSSTAQLVLHSYQSIHDLVIPL